jgi:hypothetical protein
MKRTVKFAAIVLLVSTAIFATSCGGNANKKQSAETETATETKAETAKSGAVETTDEVQPLLAKYGLSVDAIKPQGAIYAFVMFEQENVCFHLPQGAELDKKANFTRMLNAVKTVADDGKIWKHGSKETEFDMALFVTNSASGHRVDYIYKGNTVSLYLKTGEQSRPDEKNNPYPSYFVQFDYF